jgi:HEAT repeat protein
MKPILFATLALALNAADLQPLFDPHLNATQRANACFALRGKADEETIRAMTRALEDQDLITCAAENLRIVKAVEPLKRALADSPNQQARAAAARALGSFQDPALIDPLFAAAEDANILVASNALAALSEFAGAAVIPDLAALAKKGGMIGDMSLERILQLDPGAAVTIARTLLASPQVPDKLYSIRVLGSAGAAADLPELRKIAATAEEIPNQRTRGFGLMPPINLARAAQSAIESIQSREREPRP